MHFLYAGRADDLAFLRALADLSRQERAMLDAALFVAFAGFCLYIAYERLSHRL